MIKLGVACFFAAAWMWMWAKTRSYKERAWFWRKQADFWHDKFDEVSKKVKI